MNDPLRDNRIFPEEMHEKAPVNAPREHKNFSWFWFVFIAALLVVLLWFAFIYQQKNPTIFSADPEITEYRQQVAVFEKLNADQPITTPEQRADKINALFGNE